MKNNGRWLQLMTEFAVGCSFCFVFALIVPLSFWLDVGRSGGAGLVFVFAASLTGALLMRHQLSTRRTATAATMLPEPAD